MRSMRARFAFAASLAALLFVGLTYLSGRAPSTDRAGDRPRGSASASSDEPEPQHGERGESGDPAGAAVGEPGAAAPTPPDRSEQVSVELRGVVVDGKGEPVNGARIYVSDDRAWTNEEAELQADGRVTSSDPDGRFAIEGYLPRAAAGRCSLVARHPGYVPRAIEIDLSSQSPVRVVLERGGALSGRVVDLAGNPVKGARVRARVEGLDASVHRVRTLPSSPGLHAFEVAAGPDGAYRIEGIPPEARVRVEATALGYIAAPFDDETLARLDARSGELLVQHLDQDVNIRLQPAYVALVGVRHLDWIHTRHYRTLLLYQGVEHPEGARPQVTLTGSTVASFPSEVDRAIDEAVRRQAGGVVALVVCLDTPRTDGAEALDASVRLKEFAGFETLTPKFEFRRVGVHDRWTDPQFVQVGPTRAVGRIRVAPEGGADWGDSPVFMIVPAGGEAHVALKLAADVDEQGRAVLPPVCVGSYDVYREQLNVASSPHRRIEVREGEFVDTSLPDADGIGESVTVRAAYHDGLPATRVGMTVKVDGRQIYYKSWPYAFKDGHEFVPLHVLQLGKALEIWVERPGYPNGVLRLDRSEIAAGRTFLVRFPRRESGSD